MTLYTRKKNLAISVEQVREDEINLPAISICSTVEGLPTFHELPTAEYPGHPLFIITTFQNIYKGQNSSTIRYPETAKSAADSMIEQVYHGSNLSKCTSDTSKMSVVRQRQSLFRQALGRNKSSIGVQYDPYPCRKCYRIGARTPLLVGNRANREPLTSPVSVKIALSRVFSSCRTRKERRGSDVPLLYMITELTRHYAALEQRGILDFGTALSGNETAKKETMKVMLDQASNDNINRNYDRLCGIYFFSGFFYPSEDAGNVKAEFDASIQEWKDVPGTTTYSTETAYVTSEALTASTLLSTGKTTSRDVSVARGVEIYFADPDTAAESILLDESIAPSVLDGPSDTLFYLKRSINNAGGVKYSSQHDSMQDLFESSNARRYNRISLGFDFEDFATNRVTMQPTMSWPEYVTDVLEFIALYTGICIFTLVSRAAGTGR
jgi:hypothetical protein